MTDSEKQFNTSREPRKDAAADMRPTLEETRLTETASASVESFCDQIRDDARQEVQLILDKAKASAQRRREDAEKEAADISRESTEAAKAEAKEIESRALAGVSLERRKMLLKAQGEIVEEVLAHVTGALKELRGSDSYRQFLIDLSVQGIMALGEEECVLAPATDDREVFSPDLMAEIGKRAREKAKKKVKLKMRNDVPVEGSGVRVYSGGRRMLYDNTLGARRERLADELKRIIAREVFR